LRGGTAGRLEHFARVVARALRDLRAAEHPGQFFDARLTVERLEAGARRPAGRLLAHPHLVLGLRRHLRQVRHAQHLPGHSEHAQLPTDHLGHRAADPGVHLVEHEAGQVERIQRGHLQREADARELAAGGDLGQRAGRLARVRAHQEFDFVRTKLGGLAGIARDDAGREYSAGHAQALHELGDPRVERLCRPTPRRAQHARGCVAFLARVQETSLQLREIDRASAKFPQFVDQALP
jgi:hypothetical protein